MFEMHMKPKPISLWTKFLLLFVKPQSYWAHYERLVTKFKVMNGVTYVLLQEPIEYGDRRNQQIDRMESRF